MKTLFTSLLFTLWLSYGLSQSSLYYFFPGGSPNDIYGDSILNNSAVLKSNGVKKIIIKSGNGAIKGFDSKVIEVNKNGQYERVSFCFPSPQSESPICIEYFCTYDEFGRVITETTKDGTGKTVNIGSTSYNNEMEAFSKYHSPVTRDSSTEFKSFNASGQLVLVRRIWKGNEILNANIYFNKDGLPDSIRHNEGDAITLVFKRREQKSNKVIEMNFYTKEFQWVYNESGKCVRTHVIIGGVEILPGGKTKKVSDRYSVEYNYNPDGTLASIVQKNDKSPAIKVLYTYFKE